MRGGDDAILVVVRSRDEALLLKEKLRRMIEEA